VQRVKCGFIPHEYSAFYTFAFFRIPQSAFYRCPSVTRLTIQQCWQVWICNIMYFLLKLIR